MAAELVRLGFPGPYRKPVTPERIAEAVVKGIESRAARIICPRRWIPYSAFRGILNPLSDWLMDRHARIQALIRQLESTR